MDRAQDRRKRPASASEVEAVARIAERLRDFERRERLADSQIALLARAIDALELGACDGVPALTEEARLPGPGHARDHAHALVQRLALDRLRERFLRLAAGIDPDRARR